MFCEKCGRPVEGEQTLCSTCAAEQATPLQEETSVQAEQPAQVAETTEATAPICDTFELNTADSVPVGKAPKKKVGLIAAIAALIVVAACAVGVIFNIDSISGFVGRTFQSPEDYFVDVESAAIADCSADLTQAYGQLLDSYNANQTAGEAEIRLTLGDELLSLLESTLQQQGANMDVAWLQEIKLSVNANVQDAAMQTALGLGLGETDLLSADVILDIVNGKGYVAFPELNEDYLYVDISSGVFPDALKEFISQNKEINDELIKSLPSEKELNDLINTYMGIVLSGVKDVEKQEQTVTIGGVSHKMVVLTAKITEADMLDIAENILKKAEKDKTLEKVIKAFGNYTNKMGELNSDYYTPADLYQEFVDAIPSALESLEEAKQQADSNNYFKLKAYVDMKNQVRGHELAVYTDGEQDGDPISWLTVVKGDTTYIQAELGEAQVTGEKVAKKNASEGFYTLSVGGDKVGTLEFENVTETSGTLHLIPSEEMMSEVLSGSGIPAALLGDNLALELSYSTQGTNKVSYGVTILMGSKALIGLTLSSEASTGGNISIPSNALDVNNQADIVQWFKNANFDNVLDALEDANVPKDLVDAARSYVDMLQYYIN